MALAMLLSCNKGKQYTSKLSVSNDRIFDSVLKNHPPNARRIDSIYNVYKSCGSDECKINQLIIFLNYLPGEVKRTLRSQIAGASREIGYERGMKKVQLYNLYFYGSRQQLDSVNRYYKMIKSWAEQNKDVEVWSECEIYYGNYFAYLRDFNTSDSLILGAIDKLKSNRVNDNNLLSTALYILGRSRNIQFKNLEAVNYLNQAADYAMKDELYETAADIYFRIGECHLMEADFNSALEAYGNALDVANRINDLNNIASVYGAIGEIYSSKNEFEKAQEYLFKSIEYAQKAGYSYQEAYTSASIAYMYFQQNKYEDALKYFDKSSQHYESIGKDEHEYEIIRNILSKAIVYNSMKQYDKAKELVDEVINSKFPEEDPSLKAEAFINLAEICFAKNDLSKAEKYSFMSLEIAKENQFLTLVLDVYKRLYQVYETNRNFEKAFEYHKLYTQLNDSLTNKPQIKKFADMENKMKEDRLKAEHDKKELTLLSEKKSQEAELKRQKITSIVITLGFLIIFVFSIVIYKNLQENKKKTLIISEQKREVETQKTIIEEKKKEVLDSIEYAKKIQEAILPPLASLRHYFPESFILYQPKDIVAGDFYWLNKVDDTLLLAAADCTGHGVPGAMVSVVCSNALNRAVNEFKLKDPGKILDQVREFVIETFEKSSSEVKDGMDISLVAITFNKENQITELKWAGANNPAWVISNNQLVEYKADKQPVGKFIHNTPFTTQVININKGDSIYLITDGFADQFGGPRGKKFKYKNLKELILENSQLPMDVQKSILQTSLEKWKSDLEQVDDVTIVGVKI